MVEVTIRRQGRAAVITIPSDLVKLLDLPIGTKLGLDVVDGMFTARPIRTNTGSKRRHYTLDELLEGVSEEGLMGIYADTAWLGEGASMGQELT